MKKSLILVVIACIIAGCSGDIKQQKFIGMSGNPKSVKETVYEATEEFGEIVEGDIEKSCYYEFDKEGFVVKTISIHCYDGDTIFIATDKLKKGYLEESYYVSKSDSILTAYTFKNRDSKTKIMEAKSSDGGFTTSVIETEGKKEVVTDKNSEGKTTGKYERYFDHKGNIIEYKVLGKDEVDYWTKLTFDNKSRLTKKEVIVCSENMSGKVGVYTYKYEEADSKGNWTKSVEYFNDKPSHITTREILY